jgi:hypothetical protein
MGFTDLRTGDHLQRLGEHSTGEVQPLDKVSHRRQRHNVGAGSAKM